MYSDALDEVPLVDQALTGKTSRIRRTDAGDAFGQDV